MNESLRADHGKPSHGEVQFEVTLAYPPVWFKPGEYWTTHEYDDFKAEDSYRSKPKIRIRAAFEDTLASVIDRASEGMGVVPGPANHAATMSEFVARIAFYEPDDDRDFDIQRMYQSPRELRVASSEDRSVKLKSWRDVTVFELLMSARLGLIQGDPYRPYICASIPQGSFPQDVLAEGLRLGADAIEAAFQFVSTSKEGLHEADRYVTGHPIESAAGADAGRRLARRLRGLAKRRKGLERRRRRSGDS